MPFAGYKDFADCVAKNADQEDPQAYCANIQKEAENGPVEDNDEDDVAERAVRFIDRAKGIIRGLIVPYTGPIGGDKDLYGTRFSANTDLALDWFPDGGRPGLYAHGFDDDLQTEVVGREIRSWEEPGRGRWLEAQIDVAHRYATEIMELVDKGMLALSSGAVDHLVRINRSTRDVERWPWVEWSLVPNPGNPEALIYHVRSADAVMHAPEVAIRIVADLDDLIPEPEPEPEPVPAMADSVTSLVRSLQPDALHALALEMGATCSPEPPAPAQPVPTVTITSSAATTRMLNADDIAELQAIAIAKAQSLTS
jgi:hypothetical protein